MTSWIEDVAECIAAASTAATVGTNVFANILPPDVDTVAVGVFEQPGPGRVGTYSTGSAWERPGILVVVRTTAPVDGANAPNPAGARSLAWTAYQAFLGVNDAVISTGSTRRFGTIEPMEAPHLYDVDAEGRQAYAFTATAWLEPGSSW